MKKLFVCLSLLFLFIGALKAQDEPLRIETGHPDLLVKVTRCQAASDRLVLDMLVKVVSCETILTFGGGNSFAYGVSEAFDDEGNKYTGLDFLVNWGKDAPGQIAKTTLPENVPLKFRVTLNGVDTNASVLTKVNLWCGCKDLGINWGEYYIELFNVPISRQSEW